MFNELYLNAISHTCLSYADGLLNEYFLNCKDFFLPLLTDLFNKILFSGFFPSQWAVAVIKPIYKKGDASDPSNYRGISLLSHLGKLFTSVLNTRLLILSDKYNTITDAQFGFRPGRSTVDAIFSLQSLIIKTLQLKNKLFSCFIDFKSAFDTVPRLNLWSKLSKIGVRGKFLTVLKSMYSNVKSCVLSSKGCSSFLIIYMVLYKVKCCHQFCFLFT